MKIIKCLVSLCLAFATGCSVVPVTTKVEITKEVVDFANTTNLVYGTDRYWIKDVPEIATALGTVYKRESKTVDGVTYYAARLVGEKGFTDLSKDKTESGEFTLGKNYSYSYANAADWSVLAAFSGSASNINEIKKKIALTSVSKVTDDEALTPNGKYCTDAHYYVSRVYVGSSSEYGLQEIKYQAKVAFAEVGGSLSGVGRSELHEIRQGVLALMLQPFNNLTKCGAQKFLGSEVPLPKSWKEELISEGFYEVKM